MISTPALASAAFEVPPPMTAEPAKGPLVFGIRFSGLDKPALTRLFTAPLPPGCRCPAGGNREHRSCPPSPPR